MCIYQKFDRDSCTAIACTGLTAPPKAIGSTHLNSFWIPTPSPLPDPYDGSMHSLAIQSDTQMLTYLWMSAIVLRDFRNAWSSIRPSVGDTMRSCGFPGTKR